MIVIADDITGAAEIAGIAFEHGHQVRLVCGCPTATDHAAVTADDITVIATDTRSMGADEAIAETRRIASHLPPLTSHLFKKTDSALRGHVVDELAALMAVTGYRRAVYLPANPSRGRIIRAGTYYIKEVSGERSEARDVPIHETAFSYDPEFPARTSVLRERFPDAAAQGIIMPDAESEMDIRHIIQQYDDGHTLFAGAADLFSILSREQGTRKEHCPTAESHFNTPSSLLVLCGSTQSRPLDLGIPIAPMPRAVYDGSDDLDLWDTAAYAASHSHSLILTMPFSHRTGKDAAVYLRTVMAAKAKALVNQHCPDHLIIEGGATAWATLQALGWSQFEIVRQVAPGVVQMSATNGTLVTLKPGSYPWGGLF